MPPCRETRGRLLAKGSRRRVSLSTSSLCHSCSHSLSPPPDSWGLNQSRSSSPRRSLSCGRSRSASLDRPGAARPMTPPAKVRHATPPRSPHHRLQAAQPMPAPAKGEGKRSVKVKGKGQAKMKAKGKGKTSARGPQAQAKAASVMPTPRPAQLPIGARVTSSKALPQPPMHPPPIAVEAPSVNQASMQPFVLGAPSTLVRDLVLNHATSWCDAHLHSLHARR
jgi:hypothetical protein